jgi:hypothetical protein
MDMAVGMVMDVADMATDAVVTATDAVAMDMADGLVTVAHGPDMVVERGLDMAAAHDRAAAMVVDGLPVAVGHVLAAAVVGSTAVVVVVAMPVVAADMVAAVTGKLFA